VEETFLSTQGRQVHVPQAAVRAGVCQFSFQDLCDKPLGAADYIAIADAFPVVFVRDIPTLSFHRINEV
jgi:predicted ATPase